MCAACDETRAGLTAEIVLRTGEDAVIVDKVLKALEEMMVEASTNPTEEIRKRIQDAMGPGAEVRVMGIEPDGSLVEMPEPPHSRDFQEPRLPGMYL